uniref:Uncharacterized protein n=1 Tax=Leptobrachium leishanense TaxID=445787 RepID=A0A8C5P716_9ANUR
MLQISSLLRVLERDLTRWAIPHITWFGRINVLKMNVLPRVLYLLQTLPIHVPSAFFRSLQSLFIRYVWAGSKPRLSVTLLTAPRSRGGLALPHLQRYYHAVHLLRLVEWSLGTSGKQWVALEHELAGRSLTSLPWLLGTAALTNIPAHPTVSVTLTIWRRLQKSTQLAPWPSPLLPLSHLPAFSPRLLPLTDAAIPQNPLPGLYIDGNRPKAPKDIPLAHPDSFLTTFHMHCLITYLRSLAPLDKYTRPLTTFEQVITRKTLPQHGISTLYGVLQNLSPPHPHMWRNGKQNSTKHSQRKSGLKCSRSIPGVLLLLVHKKRLTSCCRDGIGRPPLLLHTRPRQMPPAGGVDHSALTYYMFGGPAQCCNPSGHWFTMPLAKSLTLHLPTHQRPCCSTIRHYLWTPTETPLIFVY